jgi:hypothetical protein
MGVALGMVSGVHEMNFWRLTTKLVKANSHMKPKHYIPKEFSVWALPAEVVDGCEIWLALGRYTCMWHWDGSNNMERDLWFYCTNCVEATLIKSWIIIHQQVIKVSTILSRPYVNRKTTLQVGVGHRENWHPALWKTHAIKLQTNAKNRSNSCNEGVFFHRLQAAMTASCSFMTSLQTYLDYHLTPRRPKPSPFPLFLFLFYITFGHIVIQWTPLKVQRLSESRYEVPRQSSAANVWRQGAEERMQISTWHPH